MQVRRSQFLQDFQSIFVSAAPCDVMCSIFDIVGFESNGARCGFAGAGRNKIYCDLVQERYV